MTRLGGVLGIMRVISGVRRHRFGPEGHAYVRDYLEAASGFGKLLGGQLLQHHDVDRGQVWSFAIEGVSEAKLNDFRSGAVVAREVATGTPGLYRVVVDEDWRRTARGWLSERLRGRPDGAVVVEDPLAAPTDDWLAGDDGSFFFCDQGVYEVFSPEGIDRVHLDGWARGPDVGIVTAHPAIGEWDRAQIEPDVLATLAAAASEVMVGAWDGEGWLVWTPADG